MELNVAQVDQDEAKLNELESWLAWLTTQPASTQTEDWLAALRRLRRSDPCSCKRTVAAQVTASRMAGFVESLS